MDALIVTVAKVRFPLQTYTSARVLTYVRRYPQEMMLAIANANLEVLRMSLGDQREVVKAIAEEDPKTFYQTAIGPSIGRTWLIAKKDIDQKIDNVLESMSQSGEVESRRMLEKGLAAGVLVAAENLDKVVEHFSARKKEIAAELDGCLDVEDPDAEYRTNQAIKRYLKDSVRQVFGSAARFSEDFAAKYHFDRVLQGDFYNPDKEEDIQSVSRRCIMRRFNQTVAPKLISDFSLELFSSPENN